MTAAPILGHRDEDGARLACLLWEFGPGWRAISSAVLGGGIGPAAWALNAQVVAGYARTDPVEHLLELAPPGPGVGMLTAASVDRFTRAADGGVEVVATVGLRVPTWAAAPEGVPDPELAPMLLPEPEPEPAPMLLPGPGPAPVSPPGLDPTPMRPPGTVNIIVAVPVAMSDAALVNAIMTVTEAKTQALLEAGFPCTGTASDAVCVAVPEHRPGHGPEEPFGGPRSVWGARIARAVHAAVREGAHLWSNRDASTTQR